MWSILFKWEISDKTDIRILDLDQELESLQAMVLPWVQFKILCVSVRDDGKKTELVAAHLELMNHTGPAKYIPW